MKITQIEKQKKDESRFSIFIDNKFAFGLSGIDVLYYKLEEDMDLSPEKYKLIIDESVFCKARDKAVRFLSYRARSRKEVVDKLLQSKEDYSEDIIDQVIQLMSKYRYIDDEKFAISFIKDKSGLNMFGSVRIKHELKKKGVSENIIEQSFQQLDIDEFDVALTALNKKLKDKDISDLKEKKKAYDFLLRRGFKYETIDNVLKAYMKEYD